MSSLILIRGLPGSGKSTLAKMIKAESSAVAHLEADMYFMVGGEYMFDASKLRFAHEWCQHKTREFLQGDWTVIVSNTFTTVKELRPYFDIAKEVGIVPTVILAQNQFKNLHNVPEESLRKMRDRFQYDLSELFA